MKTFQKFTFAALTAAFASTIVYAGEIPEASTTTVSGGDDSAVTAENATEAPTEGELMNATEAPTEGEQIFVTEVTETVGIPDYPDNVAVPDRAIVITGGSNGVHRDVMRVLYDSRDVHFQDATAPRFLMIDREGNTVFGIGGFVEATMQYDFHGAIDNMFFIPHDIPVPANPKQRNRFAGDASRTNIVFQLLRNTPWGVLNAFVQGEFSGDHYALKLKQGYIRLHNVTAGYAYSTFWDLAADAPTIDYQGPVGTMFRPNLMLQYRKSFGDHVSAAISAEVPDVTMTFAPGENEKISQRCPDIPVYVQYQWGGGASHVRASAILRELSYRNMLAQENKFRTGWGVEFSGIVNICDFAKVYWTGIYGKGIGSYMHDLDGFGYDLISDGTHGAMKAPGMFGITGGLRLDLSKKVFVSSTYSQCRLYDQEGMGPDAYRRGNYAVVNCFYTPFDDFQLGIEYLHGRRTNMDHQYGTANRFNAMIKYSF